MNRRELAEHFDRGFPGWFWHVYLERTGGKGPFLFLVLVLPFIISLIAALIVESPKPLLYTLLAYIVGLLVVAIYNCYRAICRIWQSWQAFCSDREQYLLKTLKD